MLQRSANTIENVPIAESTFRIRLEAPEIAQRIRPGQFLMLRLQGLSDPLLGRPFALYDTVLDKSGSPVAIDVVYLIVGKMTRLLTTVQAGDRVEIWGPLGNGFLDLGQQDRVNFVAGGIGQTPFLAFAKQLLGVQGYAGEPAKRTVEHLSLYYGVRTARLVAGVDDFGAVGVDLRLASDDGSIGRQGFVTQLLEAEHPAGPLVGCGPEPMLHSLARLAERWGVTCHVSLETPMACGFGVCFSCVTRVRVGEKWDYRRVCVEGPVFDAASLVWEQPKP